MTTKKKSAPPNIQRRARQVGLVYVKDFETGIRRRRCGKGFSYLSKSGQTIKAKRTRARIEALAIPPAWEDVWICSNPKGHIQAIGYDAEGRRQYIYHSQWHALSTSTKFDRLLLMSEMLPRIRRRVRKDLRGRELRKSRVLAAIVRVFDKTCIRVGNERYTKQNGSRGATTLTARHVEVDNFRVALDFPSKSGQRCEMEFTDRKVARVIRQCEEIDGKFLFCYRDDEGQDQPIHSTDVNTYLREITKESITAKDFRTWWGSVTVLAELADTDRNGAESERRAAVSKAVAVAAEMLGNTKAVCRKSYIHPGILTFATSSELPFLLSKAKRSKKSFPELTIDETRLAKLLLVLESV